MKLFFNTRILYHTTFSNLTISTEPSQKLGGVVI